MATVYSGTEPYSIEYESRGILKRVSWGALFAGLVVSLVIELVLSLLGLGIGLGSIKPATEAHPMGGIGTGAAIWMGITTLIALFCGGWVTARLAGSIRGLNGVLHSIVMWGLVTLVSFYLMSTAVGSLVSGAAGIVGKGLSAVSSGVKAVAPQAKDTIQQQLAERGITVDSVMNQAKTLLSQTGKPELQPGQIRNEAEQATRGSGAGGAQTPQAVEQELRGTLQKIFASGQTTVNAADRDALVNVLVNRTNMDRAQAEQTVDGWIQQYQQVAQQAQQGKQQALQAAQNATQTLSKVSIWAFVLMVLEAIVAAIGGWLGAVRPPEPAAR